MKHINRCIICGREFETVRSNARTCSAECRSEYANDKRRSHPFKPLVIATQIAPGARVLVTWKETREINGVTREVERNAHSTVLAVVGDLADVRVEGAVQRLPVASLKPANASPVVYTWRASFEGWLS